MVKIFGKALAVPLLRTRALLRDFGANTRANVAIIFALSAIPVVAAIGCVVDYSYATMIKTKLQAAADAAAVATVSNNSPIVVTAKAMSGNGTVSGGQTYIQNFFSADTTAFSGVTATGSTTKSGMTVTATLNYSYNVPTTFMKVLGYPNIALSGSSTGSVTLATYISFYLMLDVSGSMSFPSTTAEQVRLMSVNPDNLHPSNSPPNSGYPQGCQFACHWATQNTTCQNHSNPANQYTRPVARVLAPGPTAVPQRGLPDYQSMAERLSRRLLHGIFDKPSRHDAGVPIRLRPRRMNSRRPLAPMTAARPQPLQAPSRALPTPAPPIRRAVASMSIGPIPRSPRAPIPARRRAFNCALTRSATR